MIEFFEIFLQGGRMDFIERLFGISPDDGNGLLEISLVLTLISIIVLPALLRYGSKLKITRNRPRRE
jgi:hypothetical protein